MSPLLDIQQCLRDQPDFRLQVHNAEQEILQMENHLKIIVKAAQQSVQASQGRKLLPST